MFDTQFVKLNVEMYCILMLFKILEYLDSLEHLYVLFGNLILDTKIIKIRQNTSTLITYKNKTLVCI